MNLIATASQTVGPFFNFGLTANEALGRLAGEGSQGERIRLSVGVLDADGIPAAGDAMIEIWQADACGKYDHAEDTQPKTPDPHFRGFGRLATDENGVSVFETVKPGRVPGLHGALQAPHINVSVFARGLLKQLWTRIYFAAEPSNEEDEVLRLIPEDRRETLMAHCDPERPETWHIEIRLQGDRETVFFEV